MSHAIRCRLCAEGEECALSREGTGHRQVAVILVLINALKNESYFTEQRRIRMRKPEAEGTAQGKEPFLPSIHAMLTKRPALGSTLCHHHRSVGAAMAHGFCLAYIILGGLLQGPEGGEIGTQLS